MFVILAIISIGCGNIGVTKLIAEIWEHDDVAKKEVRWSNKQSSHSSD